MHHFAFDDCSPCTLQPPRWHWWEDVRQCGRVKLDECGGAWSTHLPLIGRGWKTFISSFPFGRSAQTRQRISLQKLSVLSEAFLSAEQLTTRFICGIHREQLKSAATVLCAPQRCWDSDTSCEQRRSLWSERRLAQQSLPVAVWFQQTNMTGSCAWLSESMQHSSWCCMCSSLKLLNNFTPSMKLVLLYNESSDIWKANDKNEMKHNENTKWEIYQLSKHWNSFLLGLKSDFCSWLSCKRYKPKSDL